ncbi:uncharacterized protein CCOS01_05770 [Colletotrichum costaricense]|uniref:Uncharacterized protein n=2 Tax=Colletotrichum acutatum species complex TaxID=2707335 RepID=A0AAJ0E386_9PEZI|nr:uncharacterized protein CCOS01_05770 [Colletotrichum costaricense]XP_060388366.1 uncharacterized protein CTAM01_00858 [Colletotrichum tamarilloi]KAK1511928.1 hypothetical protein CTAM01_00858 [Colletotrichum tamarilloi]KAK1530667.1 hypothetical protein CCOS01_05770 [Colletotrichum costaricense]
MNPSCSTSWHNPALGQPSGACREAELTRHSDIRGLLVGVGGAMWAGGKTLRHQAILRLKALVQNKEVLPWTDQSRDPSVANPELSMAPRNCKVPWRILTFCCYCSSKTCVKSSLSRTPELGLDVSKTLARASAGLWPVWVLLLFSVADPSHSASDLSYLRHVGNSGYLALLV